MLDSDLKITITGTFLFLFFGIVFFYFELLPADGVMDLFIVPVFVLICFPFVKIVGFRKNQKEKKQNKAL
jgi:EamA domain-containing membrane protein RarD